MLFWDPTYVLIIPAIIFAMVAQYSVSSTFQKYSKVINKNNITAHEAVRRILDEHVLNNVTVEHIKGILSDHFDPKNNVIRLSDSVYNSKSVAAIGVAAHEAGHAIQYSEKYLPIKIRAAIIPITQFGSRIALPLIIIGLLFYSSMSWMVDFGIILYSSVVLFQLITLPVEFNASRRALQIIDKNYILDSEETKMVKRVLGAAALTYVAATFSAVMSLLRLILISNRRRR